MVNMQRKSNIHQCVHLPDGSEHCTNPVIARAMRSLEAAIPQAQANSELPTYHFRAPAQWMGDINGPIHHNGYYHIFYQHNPYSARFGTAVYWGHARSKDLVFWEHLPIALWPSEDEGEERCYSGCTVVNNMGTPMIFYTSVGSSRPLEQWAAIGDEDLISWEKHPDNPLLHQALHSDVVNIGGWRDPFIFKHEGNTYLINGGSTVKNKEQGTKQGIVSLYLAENDELTQWKYLGPLFCHPTSPDNACPNFFKIGDKWVLFMSRHNPHVVNYLVGSWDLQTFKFQPEFSGTMGYSEDMYATQGLYDKKGRLIVWGTMHSYRSDKGWIDWPGCLTLPRVISLRSDGLLGFEPLPELKRLRRQHHQESDIRLCCSSHVPREVKGDTLEIIAEFEPQTAEAFGMKLRCSDDGKKAVIICYDEQGLLVDGKRGLFNKDDKELTPFKLREYEKTLRLHVFLDKRALEVYSNGRACFSRLINSYDRDLGVEVFAEDGSAMVRSLDSWEMKSIW